MTEPPPRPAELRDDDRRLFWLLDRARTALRARLETLVQERTGVSAAQLGAVFYLASPARADGCRPGALAIALGLTAAAATGLGDRMEAAGLVRRGADPSDGRAQVLELTAAGRRAAARARPVVEALQAELTRGFDERELAAVARFLRTAIERAPTLGAEEKRETSMSIVVQTDAGVMTIRIDRPEKKNALTIAMYRAMTDAIASSDRDGAVRAIAIVGAPTVFSAGNDLGDFMKAASGGGDAMAPLAFLHAISAAPKPIVAGVGGLAIGIGTTMLLHCDLVYATASARFRTPFVDLGLVPEAASSLLMPMLMGPRRAAAMLLAGEELDAAGAREVGLINAIVDDAEAAALAAARRLAGRPPGAMLASKRLMKRAHAALVAEQIRVEGEEFGERLRSPEAMAAFMAFSQRK